MKSKFLIALYIIIAQLSFGQAQAPRQKGPPPEYKELIKKALDLYYKKDYKESAYTFSEAFKSNRWLGLENDRYNAACSWALAGYPDSAFFNLNRIVMKLNYSNYNHIIVDPDLNSLHNDKRWQPLIDKVKDNLVEYEKKYSGDTINFISINDIRNKGVSAPDKYTAGHKDGEVRIDRMRAVMPGKGSNKLDTSNVYKIYFYKIYKEVANIPAKSYLQSYFVSYRSDEDYDQARYTWRKDTVVSVTLFNSKTNKRRNFKLAPDGQQVSIIEETTLLNMQELQNYLEETKKMVQEEKYKEANERYTWFYNHALENDYDMRGVRNSFMLGYWMDLARVYPPAMDAMKAMRDNKTNQIFNDFATLPLANDAMSLNSALKEDAKSIELFEFLTKKYPKLAEQCFWQVREPLFDAKRYDLLRHYITNPLEEYAIIHEALVNDTSMFSDPSLFSDTARYNKIAQLGTYFVVAGHRNTFVVKSVQLIEFCLATDNSKDAKEIQQKALSVIDDKRLHDSIPMDKK